MAQNETRILIVDDDPAMSRLLRKWLDNAGYTVQIAKDGLEAASLIQDDTPDVLLTDWEMPEMNGEALCRWLRTQELPHYVYTIFLTSRCDSVDMVQGLRSGADDFLKKPIDKGELLARLTSGERVIELEKRLNQIARSDSLTGLPTQRTFYDELTREFSRARRHDSPLSCVMIDLDYFKCINDTHGHPMGDQVLKAVAKVLSSSLRVSDMVSRYGGEEFCVFLPETDEQAAVTWAERTRIRINSLALKAGQFKLKVSASLGVAELTSDAQSPQELVDRADQALMVAKQTGRDRVVGHRTISGASGSRPSVWIPGAIFGELAAKNVMTAIVGGLDYKKTLSDAAQYFLQMRVTSAPVVNEKGELVGIISEADVMEKMLGADWWGIEIRDAMRANVISYEEDAPAISIYEFLCRVSIGCIVIVKQGRPTGIISRASLLRWFVNALRSIPYYSGQEDYTYQLPGSANEKLGNIVGHIAEAFRQEATRLRDCSVQSNEVELLPCLVSTASRMQDLTNDLLSCSSEYSVRQAKAASTEVTTSETLTGIGHLLNYVDSLQVDTVRGP